LVGLGLLSSLTPPNHTLPPLSESLPVRWEWGFGSLGWVGSSLVLTPPSLTPSPHTEPLSVR